MLAKMASLYVEDQFFSESVIAASPGNASGFEDAVTKLALVDVNAIIDRNFFDDKETVKDDTKDDVVDQPEDKPEDKPKNDKPMNTEPVKTSLNITLISTLAVGDGKNPYSSAVIKSSNGTDTYSSKSKTSFAPNTKIVQVLPKKVIFTNGNKLEFVEIEDLLENKRSTPTRTANNQRNTQRVKNEDDGATSIEQEGDSFKIPKKIVDAALQNIAKLYTDIRAVPYMENGKQNGFRLLSVKRGTLFDKLGLRRYDILKAVNGKPLDLQSGMQTFNELRNEREFTLELKRRNQDQTFKYEIVD